MEDQVSSRENGIRDYCGVGNVIVPKDKDIVKYINRCFRTGMISIVLENGGIVDNVLMSKSAMKELEFPIDYQSLGSQVIWINKPIQNQPIVIGIITKNNEFVNIEQNKDSLRKASSKGVYEVIVDRDKGVIVINASSTTELAGDIYIISTNKNKTSKLSVKISGSIIVEAPELNIISSKKVSVLIKDPDIDETVTMLVYEKGKGLSYKDEFGNECYLNKDNIQFKPVSRLNIGEGKEAIILGDTLKTNITKEQQALTILLNAIKNAPVTPGDGGATFKASLIAAITSIQRGDYSSILSKIGFTD